MSNALVELHCHILPGIDDGAKDLDMSMSLIRKELQDGAAGIVFTPHFHYERISVEQFTARRKAAFLQVSAACRAEGLRLAGKMGAEVFYSTALPSLDLRQLAFAGSNYILIEFPTTMHPPGIDETLYAIRAQGYTPILAHVERYPFVTEDPTLLYNWVCDGCLAQINATGLIRDVPGRLLWHLPLNLFFYSPDTSLQSIAAQLVVCVTLGVFFTFAYEKCGKNIWLPVVLHYLNNSMVLVWTGTADISNQIISWTDVAISAIMYGVVFLPFLAAKCYRKNK